MSRSDRRKKAKGRKQRVPNTKKQLFKGKWGLEETVIVFGLGSAVVLVLYILLLIFGVNGLYNQGKYDAVVKISDHMLAGDYTYNVSTVATSNQEEKIGYDMESTGVISPDYMLEYYTNEGSEDKYILNAYVDDKFYVNDGILEDVVGMISDVNIGYFETDHPQGLWYAGVMGAIENIEEYALAIEAQEDGTHYTLLTEDKDEIGRHLGYINGAEGLTQSLMYDVVVENNKLIAVLTALEIEYTDPLTGELIIEKHIQTVDNFQDIEEPKKLAEYHLELSGEYLVYTNEELFSECPPLLHDVPFGATTIGLDTPYGYMLIGQTLDDAFVAELNKSSIKINTNESDDALLYTKLGLIDDDFIEVYYSENTKMLLGLRYHGDFVTTTLRAGLEKEDIDPHRIAAGFEIYKRYERDDLMLYTGLLGGMPYVIEVGLINNEAHTIGVLPFVFYNAEQNALYDVEHENGEVCTDPTHNHGTQSTDRFGGLKLPGDDPETCDDPTHNH